MPSRISKDINIQSEPDLYSLISANGFLPVKRPLQRLPDTYYQPWERVMDKLPILIKKKAIRNTIDNLDVLQTDRLNTESEWQRAYVILCFLAHSYIWGGDIPSEVSIARHTAVFRSNVLIDTTTMHYGTFPPSI